MNNPNIPLRDEFALDDDLPLAKNIANVLTLEIHNFLKQQKALATASPDKSLSIVSHEFGTPIASLRTVLQMIQRRLESNPQKFNFEDNAAYVAYTLREIDKLTVLVDDLLDFNRLNRGALKFEFTNIDVQPTVTKVVERMIVLCGRHTITYMGRDISFIASLDAPRFEQVLDNVLSNAIKYSPENSIILVNMKTSKEGLVITIHNRGAGIPEDEQEPLFEPYYRTPSAEASSIGGLGIGLFISQQIVKAHRGTITLESKTGEGATVTILLPHALPMRPGEVTHTKNEPVFIPSPPERKK